MLNIGNRKTIYDFDNAKNKMEVYNYLTEALENIANVGLYYPFTAKYQELTKDEIKFVVDHTHSSHLKMLWELFIKTLNLFIFLNLMKNFIVNKNFDI